MKILYVTAISNTIDSFLIPHINYLKENGATVDIACKMVRKFNDSLDLNTSKFHEINFSRNIFKINYPRVIKQIKKLQDENNYDIVHVHTPIAAFLTRFALRNYDLKVIYTAHGFHFFKGAPKLNWIIYYPLERIAARWTDRLITINKEDYERAKTFKLRKKNEVKLMNGVGIQISEYSTININKSEYRKSLGLKDDDFVMLILADLNKNKNHIKVIEAVKILKDKGIDIKVLCAGEGPLKAKLESNVNGYKVQNNVKFLGYRTDVKELIYCSNCVGLFSMREGLPKSLMESLAIGRPIITSNIRGCRDICNSERIGILVNPKNSKSIANGLLLMLNNRYDLKVLKKEVKKYRMENVLKQVNQFHRDL